MKRLEIIVPDDLWEKIQQYRWLYRTKVGRGKPLNMGILLRTDLEVRLNESIRYLERIEVVSPKVGRPGTTNHFNDNNNHGTSNNSL